MSKFLTACAADKMKILRFFEDAGGDETVDVGMIGEVVAEGMNGEDDASTAIG